MRKIVTLIGISIILAISFASFIPGAALSPKEAGACGNWYTERDYNSTVSTFDTAEGIYVNLTFGVATHNDGCNNRYYVSYIQGSDDVLTIHASLRVWVCGTYKGMWTEDWGSHTYGSVLSSPPYYYGSCGRQADNYGTYAWDNSFSPYNTVSHYINQG